MRPPTDFEILKDIYNRHRAEYAGYMEGGRSAKIFVPVDYPGRGEEV